MPSVAFERQFRRLAFRHQPFLAFCGFVIVALVLGGCSKPEQMVDVIKLKELKDWQAVPLSNMLNKPADAVCVLRRYQTAIYEEVPFRDRVNAYLKAANYVNLEDEWAFVFVYGDSVTVQKFSEHDDRLGLATGHPSLPRTFKAVACAKVDRARIMRIPGPAVILGEDR